MNKWLEMMLWGLLGVALVWAGRLLSEWMFGGDKLVAESITTGLFVGIVLWGLFRTGVIGKNRGAEKAKG